MRPPSWLGRALRIGVPLAAVVPVVLVFREQGGPAYDAVREVGPAAALGSLAAVLVGLLASAMVWRALLADLGTTLGLRPALHVFFLGQLGKYIPGSVFAIAAQMELGRSHGAPRSRVGTTGLVFMGVLVATGLLTAAIALPLTSPGALSDYAWVLLLLPAGLFCLAPPVLTRLVDLLLRALRRDPLERPLSWRGTATALAWGFAMWAAYGLHLFLLVRTQGLDGGPHRLLLSLGAYALAWTAGLLFVVAPAGAGVRELALVVSLAPVLPRGAALAVAVLSRLLMTVGDLLWAAVGALLRSDTGPGNPGQDGAGVATVTTAEQLGKAADA